MKVLQKHIYLAILIFWSSFVSFCQEVKLGLPLGHDRPVIDAQFSKKGKYILSASWDGTAKLFETTSGKLLHTMDVSKSGGVSSIQFSPNEKYIIATSKEGTPKVFDVETGTFMFELGDFNSYSAIFSHDGNYVVTSVEYGKVSLYDFSSGDWIRSLSTESSERKAFVKFSPLKNTIVVSKYGTVDVFNLESEKALFSWTNEKGWVTSLNFSNNGDLVVVGYENNDVNVYNIKFGKLIHSFNDQLKSINSVQFSTNDEYILLGSSDGEVKLYNTISGILMNTFYFSPNDSVQYSPDGNFFLTTSAEPASCKLYDVKTGELIHSFNDFIGMLNNVRFSDNGKLIVFATDDKSKLYDVNSGLLIKLFESRSHPINSIKISPNSNQIATANTNGKSLIVDLNSGKTLKYITQSEDALLDLKYSLDGNYFVTAAKNGTINVFDAKNWNLLNSIKNPNASIEFIDINKTSDQLLATLFYNYDLEKINKENVKIYSLKTGATLRAFNLDSIYIASSKFSSEGKFIFAVCEDLALRKLDAKTGSTIDVLNTGGMQLISAEISPNDTYLAWNDQYVNDSKIYNINSGDFIHSLKGHTSWVFSTSFSQDSKYAVTSSEDKTSKVYEVESRLLLNTFTGHSSRVTSSDISSTNKYIVTASLDGSFIVFDFDSGKQFIRHFIFENDPKKWVHLHPSGLFDASPEAMELMYWTKGLEVIEFSQLKDRYWLPGLWDKVMKGEKLPDVRNMSELKLQPKVEILMITNESVTIHLIKRDGGYGRVTLFINGKEAINDVRPPDMDYTLNEQTFIVSIKDHPYLLDGENEITVKASSEDGFVQGRGSKSKTLITKEVLKQPQFFGVVIGVGDYANSQLNLKYTVNDAEAISKAMQLGAENLFNKDRTHIYTITSKTDKLPSKANIKSVFQEISAKANAEDIITVYLSGHGITWGGDQGDFYFLTSDATATSNEVFNDPVIRENNTISTSEWVDWLKDIPALKQVMIIDACGSGKAVDNLISERDIEPSQIKAIDRMKDRTGMYIISGCTADAVSYEASMYGQGLLTYSILQAIKGAALKEDKYVDIFTIMNYARETVPKLAEGIGGVQEPQLLVPRGGSFDIGMLGLEDRGAIPLASPKTVFVRSTLINADEFEDNLGLSEMLNQELSIVSSKGRSSSLVYFDSAKFPNACKISGGYTISEDKIAISLKLRCGQELRSFNLNASTKEELINEIIKIIDD